MPYRPQPICWSQNTCKYLCGSHLPKYETQIFLWITDEQRPSLSFAGKPTPLCLVSLLVPHSPPSVPRPPDAAGHPDVTKILHLILSTSGIIVVEVQIHQLDGPLWTCKITETLLSKAICEEGTGHSLASETVFSKGESMRT